VPVAQRPRVGICQARALALGLAVSAWKVKILAQAGAASIFARAVTAARVDSSSRNPQVHLWRVLAGGVSHDRREINVRSASGLTLGPRVAVQAAAVAVSLVVLKGRAQITVSSKPAVWAAAPPQRIRKRRADVKLVALTVHAAALATHGPNPRPRAGAVALISVPYSAVLAGYDHCLHRRNHAVYDHVENKKSTRQQNSDDHAVANGATQLPGQFGITHGVGGGNLVCSVGAGYSVF